MADEIRKWHATIAKNTIGTTETAESDAPTLRDYVTMAESATLVMQARQCIVNALITDTVTWTDDPDRDVPHELYTFIETAVDYLMITGFLVWRAHPDIGIEVAHPIDMSVAMNTDGTWRPVARAGAAFDTDGWNLAIMDQPMVDAKIFSEHAIADRRLRSAVARAYHEAVRVSHIETFWLRRDAFNSRPTVWTSVAQSLTNANGSTRPWFRGIGGGGLSVDRTVDPEVDFNALIHRRAETIAALDEATERDNARVLAAEQPFAGVADIERGRGAHTEHVVTDGKDYKPTAALIAQTDGTFYYNRARQSVLSLLGVPAQAIGESVNSERTAANHRQYEVAMATFDATVTKYRRVISDAIAVATRQPSGAYVAFTPCMTQHTLIKLAPVLKTETYIDMLACAHRLDADAFDPARVAAFQDAFAAGGQSTKTDSDRGEATQQRALKKAGTGV